MITGKCELTSKANEDQWWAKVGLLKLEFAKSNQIFDDIRERNSNYAFLLNLKII